MSRTSAIREQTKRFLCERITDACASHITTQTAPYTKRETRGTPCNPYDDAALKAAADSLAFVVGVRLRVVYRRKTGDKRSRLLHYAFDFALVDAIGDCARGREAGVDKKFYEIGDEVTDRSVLALYRGDWKHECACCGECKNCTVVTKTTLAYAEIVALDLDQADIDISDRFPDGESEDKSEEDSSE